MAAKSKAKLPHEDHKFTDEEMHTLTQLRPMMGGPDEEDIEVQEELDAIEELRAKEANAARMRAARTGGL
jgi:hypothetical protein